MIDPIGVCRLAGECDYKCRVPTFDEVARAISGGSGMYPELEAATHRVLNLFGYNDMACGSKKKRPSPPKRK